MKNFNSIDEALAHIENLAISSIQRKDSKVAKTIIDTAKEHVISDVYSVYQPMQYVRTYKLLNDWSVHKTKKGISVRSDRKDEFGRSIAEKIEYGRGYSFEFEYSNRPRPFIENTKRELQNSPRLRQAFKEDMARAGLRTN
ncbi:hypothetical protein ACI2JA_19810 [Alkalihalobacillus sp. NPDC078783]|uniref:hypothetical protein n=1 Tax=Streptomyces albidoflavus TaxID=1886 RepID=UPI0033DD7CD4